MSEEMSPGVDQGKKKKAKMGMIISIIGFVTIFLMGYLYSWGGMALACLPVILCVVGLIVSVMGMKGSKGMAITGLIVGIVGMIWGGLGAAGIAAASAFASGLEDAGWEEVGDAMDDAMEDLGH